MVLFVKMFAVSCYQGFYRITKLTFKNAEDAKFVNKAAAAQELPQVRRAAQVWINDLENIPAFWALGAIYVLVGASAEMAPLVFITFTFARVLHSIAYLASIQPWRTLVYMIGAGCLLVMCYEILQVLLTA
jgi:glutathione S-transferase